ncbi:MAG TPA: hypothetical protein VG122_12670 [Gemmata sp.]|jgi:hypothetical protein|nr:hypothetical protein [Gemmata sp.]
MRQFIGCAVGALIAAIALGCGSGKELPDEVPHTKEAGAIPPDPVEKAPEASDPAAKAIADRAIKAITQNQSDLLMKVRNCKLTAHGLFQLPKNQTMTEAKCLIQSMWPDRGQVTYDFGGSQKLVFGKRGVFGWWVNSPLPYVAPSEIAQVIQTDLMAQQWFLLGLGLAESGAVFFDPKNEKTAKSSTTTIKVGLKDLIVYRVAFDDQSGLPVRIEYAPLEIGQRVRVRKVITASDPAPASGLMLPTTISLTQNEQLAYRWTVDLWEFPGKMDDAAFDPPK